MDNATSLSEPVPTNAAEEQGAAECSPREYSALESPTDSILPLEFRGVTYAVGGRPLVDGLSFRLQAGKRTVVIGPNGAGKSITLRLCHGLLAPTRGSVRWLGAGQNDPRPHQAMVFQQPVLLRRSALANVMYALAVRGIPRRKRRQLAEQALERTGLLPLANQQARVLSGGEQQRLALARAWALRPQVLLLDEPTASLDPASAREVEQTITEIHRAGTKIILTTHDLGQAERLADEVLFLNRGQLIEFAPAARLFAEPATAEARAFLRGDLVL